MLHVRALACLAIFGLAARAFAGYDLVDDGPSAQPAPTPAPANSVPPPADEPVARALALRKAAGIGAPRKAAVAGALRTAFGLQLDKTCLDKMHAQGLSDVEIRKRTERNIGALIAQFGDQCWDHHPDLRPFTRSWLEGLNNLVVVCSEGFKKISPGAAQIAMYDFKDVRKSVSSTDYARLSQGVSTGETTFSAGRPIIMLSDLGADRLVSTDATGNLALLHESLHHSGANNRGDHNHIQGKCPHSYLHGNGTPDPRDIEPCDDNLMDDRVVMLSAICSKPDSVARGMSKPASHAAGTTRRTCLVPRLSRAGLRCRLRLKRRWRPFARLFRNHPAICHARSSRACSVPPRSMK